MPQDTRIGLFLMGELVAVLRANDPDAFRQWLSGGVQDLGEPVVEELLLDWLYSFLTTEEQDRLFDSNNRNHSQYSGRSHGISLFWGRRHQDNMSNMNSRGDSLTTHMHDVKVI